MFKDIRKRASKVIPPRLVVLLVVIVLMAAILIERLFYLQIIQGESYQENFSLSIKKERTLKSSRGNIYDRNGKAIAYNKLSYCVTFEDSETYNTTHERRILR